MRVVWKNAWNNVWSRYDLWKKKKDLEIMYVLHMRKPPRFASWKSCRDERRNPVKPRLNSYASGANPDKKSHGTMNRDCNK